jgi:hypothetical protein
VESIYYEPATFPSRLSLTIYFLAMAKRGVSSKAYALPPDPSWLEFERSDGDESTWPSKTARVVDHEGCVNFMDIVGLDDSHSARWRHSVGKEVAKLLGLPGAR